MECCLKTSRVRSHLGSVWCKEVLQNSSHFYHRINRHILAAGSQALPHMSVANVSRGTVAPPHVNTQDTESSAHAGPSEQSSLRDKQIETLKNDLLHGQAGRLTHAQIEVGGAPKAKYTASSQSSSRAVSDTEKVRPEDPDGGLGARARRSSNRLKRLRSCRRARGVCEGRDLL